MNNFEVNEWYWSYWTVLKLINGIEVNDWYLKFMNAATLHSVKIECGAHPASCGVEKERVFAQSYGSRGIKLITPI